MEMIIVIKENPSIVMEDDFKTIDGCNKIGHLIQSFAFLSIMNILLIVKIEIFSFSINQ